MTAPLALRYPRPWASPTPRNLGLLDYWPLVRRSGSAAARPRPAITYVTPAPDTVESDYATRPDVALGARLRAKPGMSSNATPTPCVFVNGFLKFAPAFGSSGSSCVASVA